jgi:8-oxo-dGTP pyrophosphatase MutT (NUDIX family)
MRWVSWSLLESCPPARSDPFIPRPVAWPWRCDRRHRKVLGMSDEETPSIRILRDRMVYANRYGDLYDDEVEFRPLGVRGRYVRWEWRAPYSVAVLPFSDPQTALLVRNFRHSARREVLEAIKGFGDQARDPAEVAVAELHEELGFSTFSLSFLGVTIADPSFACHPMYCFTATGQIDRPRSPEHSEAIGGVERFPLTRTPEALASGEIQDSVTLLLLWQAWQVERGGRGGASQQSAVPYTGGPT